MLADSVQLKIKDLKKKTYKLKSKKGKKLKPAIQKSEFGYLTIAGEKVKHDVVIRLSGEVKKRKKQLSKALYGTSHKISIAEAKQIFQEGAEQLIIGAGHFNRVKLSAEAAAFFDRKQCAVLIQPTPVAVKTWNKSQGNIIGLFHISC